MSESQTTEELEVTLYVRASIPKRVREHVYALLDELEDLETWGTIADLTVASWDKRVPMDGEDRLPTDVVDAYEEFEAWASDTERSLEPYFRVKEDPDGEVLVPPIMCLAVEDEDGIEAVYPNDAGGEQETVPEGIERLREHRLVAAD